MRLLSAYPHLSLSEGYTLHSILYGDMDSNGRTWAWPDDLEPFINLDDNGYPSPPPRAEEDFRQVLVCDGSPRSYLEASFFSREAWEIGSSWHGCSWGTHTLLTSNPLSGQPPKAIRDYFQPESRMELLRPLPDDWRPSVDLDEDYALVSFYTFSALWRATIYLHEDTYPAGTGVAEMEIHEIAVGDGGFVF